MSEWRIRIESRAVECARQRVPAGALNVGPIEPIRAAGIATGRQHVVHVAAVADRHFGAGVEIGAARNDDDRRGGWSSWAGSRSRRRTAAAPDVVAFSSPHQPVRRKLKSQRSRRQRQQMNAWPPRLPLGHCSPLSRAAIALRQRASRQLVPALRSRPSKKPRFG
jgi:hypothetical protein